MAKSLPLKQIEIPRNNAPTTLAGLYKYYWELLLNKLPKEPRELLLANLKKPLRVVRGQEVEYENVREFVKCVTAWAEMKYDESVNNIK